MGNSRSFHFLSTHFFFLHQHHHLVYISKTHVLKMLMKILVLENVKCLLRPWPNKKKQIFAGMLTEWYWFSNISLFISWRHYTNISLLYSFLVNPLEEHFIMKRGNLSFSKILHTFSPSRDSSVGRASDWRSEGPWFDPRRWHFLVRAFWSRAVIIGSMFIAIATPPWPNG